MTWSFDKFSFYYKNNRKYGWWVLPIRWSTSLVRNTWGAEWGLDWSKKYNIWQYHTYENPWGFQIRKVAEVEAAKRKGMVG